MTNGGILQMREDPQRLTEHELTLNQESRVHYLLDVWLNLTKINVPEQLLKATPHPTMVNRIIIKQHISYFPISSRSFGITRDIIEIL